MTAPLITSVPSQTETLDERRWKVMIAKSYEGIAGIAPFVIGVRTTGIFCRVGCPARRPLRRNVHFSDTIAEAVAAGYRACKRCHPDRGDLTPWAPVSTRTAARRAARRSRAGRHTAL